MRELGALDAAHGSRAEDVWFVLEAAYTALQHQWLHPGLLRMFQGATDDNPRPSPWPGAGMKFSHPVTHSTGWAVKNTPCPSYGAKFLLSFACSACGCCKQLSELSWLTLGPLGGTSASLRANSPQLWSSERRGMATSPVLPGWTTA